MNVRKRNRRFDTRPFQSMSRRTWGSVRARKIGSDGSTDCNLLAKRRDNGRRCPPSSARSATPLAGGSAREGRRRRSDPNPAAALPDVRSDADDGHPVVSASCDASARRADAPPDTRFPRRGMFPTNASFTTTFSRPGRPSDWHRARAPAGAKDQATRSTSGVIAMASAVRLSVCRPRPCSDDHDSFDSPPEAGSALAIAAAAIVPRPAQARSSRAS